MAEQQGIVFEGKTVEQMGTDTLRRYVTKLEQRILREAWENRDPLKYEEKIKDAMRQVIREERKRFDVVKFIRWLAEQIVNYFKTFYKE